MKKVILSAVFVFLIVLSAVSVFAADGFYTGIGFGISKARNGCNGSGRNVECNDIDPVIKVFGGYQFSQNMGLELTSSSFGPTEGVNLAAVGTVPISEKFGIFGKAGFLYWNTNSGMGTMLGVGGKYNINAQTSVRAEWERFNNIASTDTYSLGITTKSPWYGMIVLLAVVTLLGNAPSSSCTCTH